MPEDLDTLHYKRMEISRALTCHLGGDPLRIKVIGSEDQSRYLNATVAQVRVIREILGGGSHEEILAAVAAVIEERQ